VTVRRGSDPARAYRVELVGPGAGDTAGLLDAVSGQAVPGAVLGYVGLWLPRRRPETVILLSLAAMD
jgi:hypothetical protein